MVPLRTPAADAVSAADVAYALGDLFACRAAFDTVYRLLLAKDFEDASPLLFRPPIARFEGSLTQVVTAPGLAPEDRVAISALRLDVGRSIDELTTALEEQDAKAGRRFAKAARSSLDEILSRCEAGGLLE